MTKDKIMALADAYADAMERGPFSRSYRGNIQETRAALEAALTEKQEPYAWAKPDEGDYAEAFNWTRNDVSGYTVPLYTHPAPVNQQLLEALKASLWRMEGYGYQAMEGTIAKARAAIAKLKEVRGE